MVKEAVFLIIFSIYISTCSGACISKTTTVDVTAGGFKNADTKDSEVIAAADYAINELYGSRNYELVSAKTQVVAGKNYLLAVQFPDSGEQCEITVYDRFGPKSITSNTCSAESSTTKDLTDGGLTKADINDPSVIAASDFAISNSGFGFEFTNYKLLSAEQQIVAGIAYYLTYSFPDNGDTVCLAEVIYQSWTQPQYIPVSVSC